MISSHAPSEVYLGSPHGDFLVTVGYDFELGGYYVTMHNRSLREWNSKIYDILKDMEYEEPFDLVRLHDLEAALAEDFLDRREPLRIDEVVVILGLIATANDEDITAIANLQERRH